MDEEQKHFFMMTVEIRILASLMTRISGRSIEERFNSYHKDISGLQYGILRTLSHESLTLSELSRTFVLDPSTLVPVIDNLERKQLVTRSRDPQDRRRMPLLLTQTGIDLIRNVPAMNEDDMLFRCLGSMGEDKARELLSLLREVVKNMPEGEEMIHSISSRLYAYQKGENVTPPPGCVIHRRENVDNEQDHLSPRIHRRRVRGSRNQSSGQ